MVRSYSQQSAADSFATGLPALQNLSALPVIAGPMSNLPSIAPHLNHEIGFNSMPQTPASALSSATSQWLPDIYAPLVEFDPLVSGIPDSGNGAVIGESAIERFEEPHSLSLMPTAACNGAVIGESAIKRFEEPHSLSLMPSAPLLDDLERFAADCDLLPKSTPQSATSVSNVAALGSRPPVPAFSPIFTDESGNTSASKMPLAPLPIPDIGTAERAGSASSIAKAATAAATANATDPRKLKCPFPGCKMQLSRPSHLEKHVRTHTNERPHACPTCDMAFKTKWTLKKHMRIHSGEKPFHCDYPGCGKYFTQRGTYRRHQRLHSDKTTVLKCFCGKTFKQRSNYTAHVRSHSISREFPCTLCSKTFKSARSLEKHQLHHVTNQLTEDGRRIELQKRYCRYCSKAFHYVTQPDGNISAADIASFKKHEASHTATTILPVDMPTLSMEVPGDVAALAGALTDESANGGLSVPRKGADVCADQKFVLQLC